MPRNTTEELFSSPFAEGDEYIWIPVANGKDGGLPRAFLPFKGLLGSYRYGYKAEPSVGQYLHALREVQQAAINDETKTFLVDKGTREKQRRARWRHGSKEGASLLGPTLGWARVPVAELGSLADADVEKFIISRGEPTTAEPVLCETREELERESARLYRKSSRIVPAGQLAPERRVCSTEQFVRDAQVVAYVLLEANGSCECCLETAPFSKPGGLPYLEVHHVKRLASGGSDKVSNAVGVCPNCHRELHHGANSVPLAEGLFSRIKRLVRE